MTDLTRADAGRTQGSEQRTDALHFCTHCGAVMDDAPQRVCSVCGFGVVLRCARDAAPRRGTPFLVVTTDLRVTAASAASEKLLGDPEWLIGKPLLELVRGDASLPRQVARAAMGSRRSATAWVRTREHGRARRARIVTCGDPPAALVVLK